MELLIANEPVDGFAFKSLTRHLKALGMTPDGYRARWDLPSDCPMIAPGYAALRSELAKASGFGNVRREIMQAEVSDAAAEQVGADVAPALPAAMPVADETTPTAEAA